MCRRPALGPGVVNLGGGKLHAVTNRSPGLHAEGKSSGGKLQGQVEDSTVGLRGENVRRWKPRTRTCAANSGGPISCAAKWMRPPWGVEGAALWLSSRGVCEATRRLSGAVETLISSSGEAFLDLLRVLPGVKGAGTGEGRGGRGDLGKGAGLSFDCCISLAQWPLGHR